MVTCASIYIQGSLSSNVEGSLEEGIGAHLVVLDLGLSKVIKFESRKVSH